MEDYLDKYSGASAVKSFMRTTGKENFTIPTGFKKLDEEFAIKGFKILMVNEDDSPRIGLKYNKAADIKWTTFHWNYDMMNVLGNPGVIPVTYLVNAQDSIVKINFGEFDENQMRKLIEKILRK